MLDLIFPNHCVSCNKSGFLLCLKCLANSPQAERECAKWIFPLYDYRHPPIKKSMHLLKYRGKKSLADTFAEALYSRILEELSDLKSFENFQEPVLIPIPLAPKRRRERGFNQAELISKKIINLDEQNHILTVLTDVLVKPKDTAHQAHIENRSTRLKNLIGSFEVRNSNKIKNRNIVLVDDITTTGATLNEARKVLRQAGARKIVAFTVAH